MISSGICTGIFLLYSEDMLEIIPAIIAKDFSEVKEKIKRVESFVNWVQLDIMDGKFVPNTAWNELEDLRDEHFKVSLEAHLMINEPENYAEKWIDAGIKRVIFHIEATSKPGEIVKICRDRGIEVGVAINPETPIEQLEVLSGSDPDRSVDMILVLGVSPGFGGQKFKPEIIPKIRELRKASPHLTIGVDGGMNPETAKQVVEAGANVIVAGSYIFGSKDMQSAISELKNV